MSLTRVAAACVVFAASAHGAAAEPDLRQLVAEQAQQLDALKRMVAVQEAQLDSLRRQVEAKAAADERAAVATVGANAPAPASASAKPAATSSVAAAPAAPAPPSIAQATALFQQPGVLTPAGRFTLEPSFQYAYSSSSSVALVGYTVIPAILVGLIDVRDVKSSTLTGSLALRYGLTNRAEIEAKLPYVYRYDNSIGRAALTGSNSNSSIFDANGQGLGDVEFTGRYQFNDGGQEQPYFVGSLRLKTRTGKDPFQIPLLTNVAGFSGQGLQSELPTGSGFYGVQPALTVLYPSDPVVFFGSVSTLYSPARRNVMRQTDQGTESLGTIAPGLIFGFNFGVGIALNDRSSFSVGYDHSSIGKTLRNGAVAADSVQLQLGTLLFGMSYRLSDRRSISLAVGAGLTRDTPDVTLSLRVPTSF
jgi:hypothetical protein